MADELTPIIERIQRHIRIDHGHWIWTGGTSNGYAVMRVHGVPEKVHRLTWQCARGPFVEDAGAMLRNHCGQRSCVNPDHWSLTEPLIDTADEVTCKICRSRKPRADFCRNLARPSGINAHCRDCQRWKQRRRKYGITPEDYAKLLSDQGGSCAICRCPPGDDADDLRVDHCHKTGRVRGLLCSTCNAALGHFAEDPERIRRAAAYIESHSPELL